jgi:hypothetical protein
MVDEAHKNMTLVGRIALREEGDFWNAYYAMPDTLKGSILLGSIRISLVKADPDVKQAFILLMRTVVTLVIADTTGQLALWPDDPVAAPEHEITKKA